MILVVNKVDRPDARDRRGGRRGLRAVPRPRRRRGADRVPDRLLQRAGPGRAGAARPTRSPTDLAPLHGPAASSTSRRRSYDPEHPLQAHVTNLDASPYVGRLALCRVRNGTIRQGPADRLVPRATGRSRNATVGELYVTESLDRVDAAEAGPGEIIAVAGHPRGHDRRDARRPRRPAAAAGDHRRRAVAVGHDRHQHLAARRPARAPGSPRARCATGSTPELVGNVSLRVNPTERPDAWEVQGRGELQLAVLVELMRREGFELTVGQPQVLTREIDGRPARAGRAAGDRHPRGLRRRDHPAARAAQGPARADGQPRHRLGADGVPRPGARADRLPHRVPHRDARHRAAAPRLRPLGAVGGRAAHAADRRARRRPPRRRPPSSR